MSTLIRPGSNVRVSAAEPRGLDPTRTDTVFMPVITSRGPVGSAVEVSALGEYDAVMGGRDGYPLARDCVEALLKFGVSRIVLSRAVGDAADTATVSFNSAATPTIAVDAASPGDWGNDVDVAIIVGSAPELRTYVVTYLDVEVQRFTDQASVADAVLAMASSNWVRGTDLAGPGQPDAAAATPLAGGLSDDEGITLTELGAALDAMDGEYGRGQVVAPGWTSVAAAELLEEHAAATNRVVLVGAPMVTTDYDESVGASWSAIVDDIEEHFLDGVDISRLGAFFPQWAAMVPLSGTLERYIPWTIVEAGLIARSDRAGEGINVQPVENTGQVPSSIVTRAIPELTDLQRTALYDDRVNVAHHSRSAGLRNMGFASATADPMWRQFNFSRYAMSLAARLDVRAKQQRGGAQGRVTPATLQEFGSVLKAELLGDYEAEEIFGATPADAFIVDVGPTVNTSDTINAGEKWAEVEVTMTRSGETVVISLVNRNLDV